MRVQEGLEAKYVDYVQKHSTDDYSQEVIEFTEKWARLMEERIAAGDIDFAHMAQPTSDEANADIGITSFQYGCAVSALAYFWIHGDKLRLWHNLDTQIQDEGERANASGGVLNPAVLHLRD